MLESWRWKSCRSCWDQNECELLSWAHLKGTSRFQPGCSRTPDPAAPAALQHRWKNIFLSLRRKHCAENWGEAADPFRRILCSNKAVEPENVERINSILKSCRKLGLLFCKNFTWQNRRFEEWRGPRWKRRLKLLPVADWSQLSVSFPESTPNKTGRRHMTLKDPTLPVLFRKLWAHTEWDLMRTWVCERKWFK